MERNNDSRIAVMSLCFLCIAGASVVPADATIDIYTDSSTWEDRRTHIARIAEDGFVLAPASITAEPDEHSQFLFWSVKEELVPDRHLDLSTGAYDLAGVTQIVAWYWCWRDGPVRRHAAVAALNVSAGTRLSLNYSILEEAEPRALLERCDATPCTIRDDDDLILRSITAKQKLNRIWRTGLIYVVPEFKQWRLGTELKPEGVRRLELSTDSSHRAIALYRTGFPEVDLTGVRFRPSPEDIKTGLVKLIGDPVFYEKLCWVVHGSLDDCPGCGSDPDHYCAFEFRNAEHYDIRIVDRHRGTIIIEAEHMDKGVRRATLSAELLDKVGGMRNLGVVFMPTPQAGKDKVTVEVKVQKLKRAKTQVSK